MANKIVLQLNGLNCAGCAGDIEEYTKSLEEVSSANLDFINKKLNIEIRDENQRESIIEKIESKVKQLEPDVVVIDISKANKDLLVLEMEDLFCAGCADDIEQYAKKLEGVRSADLNFVSKKMNIVLENPNLSEEVVSSISKEMNRIEPSVKVREVSKQTRKNIEEDKTKENFINRDLLQILLAGVFFLIPYVFSLDGSIRFISFVISYLIVGTSVIKTALINIKAGNPMDEHFLMMVATIGAFIIGEYPEGVAVMLFYQLGEYFQGRAVNHSRSSIKELMDIRPDYANLIQDGRTVEVEPEDVSIGDIILIKPGERVPLDGKVIKGESTLDTSNITGESVPKTVKVGEDIVSGVVNNSGLLEVEVSKEFGESTITKILDLVENASSRKAPTENFITKFSRYYTPVVVYVALAIGVLPPLLFKAEWAEWAYRAFVFLVISCPCALVISIPLGFFGGIGAASKEGVLVKGGNYLEGLNDVDTIVFDKTGTISKGSFTVTEIESYSKYSKDEILKIAAYGETYSNHPIAKSIIDFYNKDIDKSLIKDYEEITGKGIRVKIDGQDMLLGNEKLLKDHNIKINKKDFMGTIVYLANKDEHIGTIVVSDELKPGIVEAISELKDMGIEPIMLSGDKKETVREVADITGIDKAYGELLPQDKVEIFEEIINSKKKDKKVAFVGDGVNDAPVLARADIGIAMGGLGSDAAIEASDIVIMTDEIHKISVGMKIASKTKRIVSQNIILALGVKLIVLALGAFGKASMWQAVFADVGVSIIAIFNSIRALKVED